MFGIEKCKIIIGILTEQPTLFSSFLNTKMTIQTGISKLHQKGEKTGNRIKDMKRCQNALREVVLRQPLALFSSWDHVSVIISSSFFF